MARKTKRELEIERVYEPDEAALKRAIEILLPELRDADGVGDSIDERP